MPATGNCNRDRAPNPPDRQPKAATVLLSPSGSSPLALRGSDDLAISLSEDERWFDPRMANTIPRLRQAGIASYDPFANSAEAQR